MGTVFDLNSIFCVARHTLKLGLSYNSWNQNSNTTKLIQ